MQKTGEAMGDSGSVRVSVTDQSYNPKENTYGTISVILLLLCPGQSHYLQCCDQQWLGKGGLGRDQRKSPSDVSGIHIQGFLFPVCSTWEIGS